MTAGDELERNEKLAEAAYDALYEAIPERAKDCFDDARMYFAKAIDAAKRAGREDEVARLTARLDHIVSVYNSQFRGRPVSITSRGQSDCAIDCKSPE